MSYQGIKGHGESQMHSFKWKKSFWKGYKLWDSSYMTVWKRTNIEKKMIKCSDLPRILGREVRVEEATFFRWWNCAVWYCNGGHMTFCMCQILRMLHKSRTLTCTCAKSLQSCPTLCDPMDCSPQDTSVRGILQARILEWVAMPSYMQGQKI